MIDDFCALSGDHQWIHQSADCQHQTHQKSSIAPGNLLLSLLPKMIQSIFSVSDFSQCLTAKYSRVNFRRPVYCGDDIELALTIENVTERAEKTFVEMRCRLLKSEELIVDAMVTDVYFRGIG